MSQKKLFVGNLNFQTTEDVLRQVFSRFGTVRSAMLAMDRETGRPRGFAFVEMGSDEEAQAAIKGLDGQPVDARALQVSLARSGEDRPREGRPRQDRSR